MHNLPAIARHELRIFFADRQGMVWTFLMPIVFAAFFGLVFGNDSDPTDAKASLAVVDGDGGPLAERLLAALETEHLSITQVTPETRDQVENPVRWLVIPAGFSRDVLSGTEVTLRLEKEPGTSAQAAFVAQTRIWGAIGRLIGELATAEAEDGLPPTSAARLARAAPDPNLVRLESRYAGQSKVIPTGFSQSIPGNAVFFVMFIALTYGAASISQERTAGVLRRLATAPVSALEIVGGKILGRVAIAAVQIFFFVATVALAKRLLGIEIGGSLFALWAVLMVFAVTVAPIGVFLGAVMRDPEQAANTGVLATMAMAGLGGCWWPLEITPPAMQRLAHALPTGWAMDAINQVVAYGRGLEAAAVPLAILLGFAAFFTVLASRMLKMD